MTFSWKQAIKRQGLKQIETNKVLAKSKQNPDFNNLHPDWIRDAAGDNPNFTQLIAETKKSSLAYQDEVTRRTMKRIGQ